MSSIKLSDIRISGFRGLKELSTSLENVTVLTGCNNVGKTSVLKALQLALGNASFLTQEDFFVNENGTTEKIIVDLCFISVNEKGERIDSFSEEWEGVFTESCIQYDINGMAFVGLRTTFNYDATISNFSRKQKILQQWNSNEGEIWQNLGTTDSKFKRDSIPFFYIEAQRDIVEDTKLRTSFIGKLLADVAKSYTPEKILEIEEQIKLLNETTISNSEVLNDVQTTLKEIESAIDNDNSEVSITPFTKKIRDLNKGITIHYGNSTNSYTMDYHGMGTRSWSSLLTFKSFILQHKKVADSSGAPFYPIITIEEPEAHLHPDAQKRLYQQIAEMPGQKIISTHSPYIASTAQLSELRNMYKNESGVLCNSLDVGNLDQVDVRALKQKVINTKGEIIFAKALVLFEGETEEQALPIFAEKYFSCNPVSLGLEFVGVGGCGCYYPFIYLAEKFNIPWYIFSDGEPDTKTKVLKAYKKIAEAEIENLSEADNIFVIDNDADFEKMLINDGFVDEIVFCLKELLGDNCIEKFYAMHDGKPEITVKTEEICSECGRPKVRKELTDYSGDSGYKEVLNRMMSLHKTDFAPLISDKIVSCGKDLPPLVKQLFDKIKEDLHICLQ
jgi:putative ATP-dependent endonuclease of OLD family